MPNNSVPTIPMTFWQTMSIAAANRKITNGFPPLIKRAKFALKPIEEKNTNIIEVCKLFSKVNAIATIKPPTTGSGILNVCKTRMRFTRKKPSNNTKLAKASV